MKRLHSGLVVLVAAAAALAGCSRGLPELAVFNWADYFAEDTIANFEKEFGCRVVLGEITSSEELRTKLQFAPSGYDVVVVNDELLPGFAAGGYLEKLDPAKLPNLKHILPRFRGLTYDPQNQYSVPYLWGTTGIAYNKEKVNPPPDSWAALWDPRHAGRVTLLADPREAFAAAMWAEGTSPLAMTAASIERAKTRLLSRKPLAYQSAPKEMLASGDAWISHAFSGDAIQAAAGAPIGFVLPREGATMWIDNLCIARGAKNPDLAHRFIDYLLRPEVSAAISNKVFYANPNGEAEKLIAPAVRGNPMVYPSDADRARLHLLVEPPPELKKLMNAAWAEVRAR
jgi:spermidine/putrescine-binding protein